MSVRFEDAKRCPKCGNTGQQEREFDRPDRSKVYTFMCMNPPCAWFETTWIVQRLEDGTVPVRDGSSPKEFPLLPGMTKERADSYVEGITDEA